jgi:hypothetical protein
MKIKKNREKRKRSREMQSIRLNLHKGLLRKRSSWLESIRKWAASNTLYALRL